MGRDPTLADVAARLRDLIEGSMSRRDVSLWARPWLIEESRTVSDDTVWRALMWLGGADLKGDPADPEREYLYEEVDFRSWLEEVEGGAIESE